ncbi:MAG: SsrA-binding protein SmpB [Aerococcus sp.]|nr:SsrA-binding protein SmpB [Aerococcus sp.]
MAKKKTQDDNTVATNRKARHDYTIEETYEAGIVLSGTEIKSVRQGRVNLKDAFARVEKGEVWVYGLHISPFKEGNRFNLDSMRQRKLLLKRKEITRLEKKAQETGYTLVPLKMYIKRGYAKVLLGVGHGKKQFDKRRSIKERDMKRSIDRAMKNYG